MKRIFGLFNFISLLLFGFQKKVEITAFLPAFLLPEYPVFTHAEYKLTPTGMEPEIFRQMIVTFISGKGIYQATITGLKTADSKFPGKLHGVSLPTKLQIRAVGSFVPLTYFCMALRACTGKNYVPRISALQKPAELYGSRKGDHNSITYNW